MGTDLLLRLDTLDPAPRDQVIQAQRLAVLGQFFFNFCRTTNNCPVINFSVLTAEASCGFPGECLPDPAFQLGLFGDEHGAHHRRGIRRGETDIQRMLTMLADVVLQALQALYRRCDIGQSKAARLLDGEWSKCGHPERRVRLLDGQGAKITSLPSC